MCLCDEFLCQTHTVYCFRGEAQELAVKFRYVLYVFSGPLWAYADTPEEAQRAVYREARKQLGPWGWCVKREGHEGPHSWAV